MSYAGVAHSPAFADCAFVFSVQSRDAEAAVVSPSPVPKVPPRKHCPDATAKIGA